MRSMWRSKLRDVAKQMACGGDGQIAMSQLDLRRAAWLHHVAGGRRSKSFSSANRWSATCPSGPASPEPRHRQPETPRSAGPMILGSRSVSGLPPRMHMMTARLFRDEPLCVPTAPPERIRRPSFAGANAHKDCRCTLSRTSAPFDRAARVAILQETAICCGYSEQQFSDFVK